MRCPRSMLKMYVSRGFFVAGSVQILTDVDVLIAILLPHRCIFPSRRAPGLDAPVIDKGIRCKEPGLHGSGRRVCIICDVCRLGAVKISRIVQAAEIIEDAMCVAGG